MAALTVAVITVSDRSYAGTREDASGPMLRDLLALQGFSVSPVVLVPDSREQIAAAVSSAAAAHDVVLTTGGTGLSPRDVTPEAVAPLLDREVPGIEEALRQANRSAVPTSVLSRGVAGTIGKCLVVTLPGSTGGVRDGAALLGPLLEHAVAQLRGGDH